MKYTLVNPFITGSINTMTEAKDEFTAAKELYSRVSKHFTNNLPKFYFSIIGEKNDLFHFQVNEKKLGKEVQFAIKKATMKKNGEKIIMSMVNKKSEQNGGNIFSKSDSSSDSDSTDSSSSPYKVPMYINPLRELLYYPTDYIIEIADDFVYEIEYPGTIYVPAGAFYTGIITGPW